MSGEKSAVDEASWEFTVELLDGILIGQPLFGVLVRGVNSFRM